MIKDEVGKWGRVQVFKVFIQDVKEVDIIL